MTKKNKLQDAGEKQGSAISQYTLYFDDIELSSNAILQVEIVNVGSNTYGVRIDHKPIGESFVLDPNLPIDTRHELKVHLLDDVVRHHYHLTFLGTQYKLGSAGEDRILYSHLFKGNLEGEALLMPQPPSLIKL